MKSTLNFAFLGSGSRGHPAGPGDQGHLRLDRLGLQRGIRGGVPRPPGHRPAARDRPVDHPDVPRPVQHRRRRRYRPPRCFPRSWPSCARSRPSIPTRTSEKVPEKERLWPERTSSIFAGPGPSFSTAAIGHRADEAGFPPGLLSRDVWNVEHPETVRERPRRLLRRGRGRRDHELASAASPIKLAGYGREDARPGAEHAAARLAGCRPSGRPLRRRGHGPHRESSSSLRANTRKPNSRAPTRCRPRPWPKAASTS